MKYIIYHIYMTRGGATKQSRPHFAYLNPNHKAGPSRFGVRSLSVRVEEVRREEAHALRLLLPSARRFIPAVRPRLNTPSPKPNA